MNRSPRYAFTLIEVLLAIAISVAIFTLSVSLFTTTSRTLLGQEQRLSGELRTLEAYTQLEKDLLQTVPALGSSNLMFQLQAPESDDGFSRLRVASLQRLSGEEDLRWTEIIRLDYFVNEKRELIREAQRDTGLLQFPGSRQVLLTEVTEFRLEALQMSEAYEDWPQEDEAALPTGVAVRLSVKARKGAPMQGRILIPAGLVVQPDIERGGQPSALPAGGGL